MRLSPHIFTQTAIILSFGILCFSFASMSVKRQMIEICDNALDDDQDGLVDFQDPDCSCELLIPTSLIPNPSFEDQDCCPLERSELDCASFWDQASLPTTDYLHTCGFMGWDSFPPPTPFPDGEGIMGFRNGRVRSRIGPEPNWKEYAGACLLTSMKASFTYRFEFWVGFVDEIKSPPIDITFFGSTDCANLPFGTNDQLFGCPTNGPGWIELGSTLVSGSTINPWVEAVIEITPTTDLEAIVIGGPCAPTQSDVSTFYFFDNLVLADVRLFDFNIRNIGNPCDDNFQIAAPENPNFDYQWYKDSIALVGETQATLSRLYGEGNYQVRVEDGDFCRISRSYFYQVSDDIEIVDFQICAEDTYTFGSQILTEPGQYIDTFPISRNCDSIVILNLSVADENIDTLRVELFSGEDYIIGNQQLTEATEELIQLTTEQGCDSLIWLELSFIEIFIPNVFSPNADGVNDRFQVFGPPGSIQTVELQIFDRWGALLFTGKEWDGRRQGELVNSGVYVYVARVWLADGIEQRFAGDVMVVR